MSVHPSAPHLCDLLLWRLPTSLSCEEAVSACAQSLAVHSSSHQVHLCPLGSAQISHQRGGAGEELLLIEDTENTVWL